MLMYLIKIVLWALSIALISFVVLVKNKNAKGEKRSSIIPAKCVAIVTAIAVFFSTFGMYFIPERHSGQITNKTGKSLPMGRLIAMTSEGERGLQSDILQPGYGYNILYPFVVDIDVVPDFVVPTGHFAILTAYDGESLDSKIVAEKWDKDVDPKRMLNDFKYFLENGGQRGIQQYKLTTSTYRLNRHQWKEIKLYPLKEVKANEVLVIESKYGKAPAFTETSDDEILSVPLVDSTDYRGIVNKAFPSGFYALHPITEKPHTVSIVLETFIYGGGYKSSTIDLGIDPENDKLQTIKGEINPPAQKNGAALEAKTKDNHTVRYDVRVLGQIEPIQAPRFIGTIKDPEVLDDKVIEPFTRNILSNITLGYTALELKDKKEEIGEILSKKLRDRTINTGFRTKTVEITNIDIPAIVLIPGKIASASIALKDALVEKELSVKQAIKVRNMQDQANNQTALAVATVANAAATQEAESILKLSEANKTKSNNESDAEAYNIAQVTKANKERIEKMSESYGKLAETLGKDNASAILLQETINLKAGEFNSPEVVVFGSGQGGQDTDIVNAHLMSKSMRNSVVKSTKSN